LEFQHRWFASSTRLRVDEILHMYDQQRALESRHPDGRQAAREPKGAAIEGQAEPASPALEAEPAQLEDTP
jgi:hypothetical protein